MGDTGGIDRLAALIAQLVQNQIKPENQNELSTVSLSAIESRIQEFVYAPEDCNTFEHWWNRYAEIFEIDLEKLDDVKKVRLLLRHVSTSVERTFIDSITPVNWSDLKLKEVTEKMLTLFGDNSSTFDRRRTRVKMR